MKISYTQEINGQPNYFIEKIWKGLLNGPGNLEESYFAFQARYIAKFGKPWEGDQFSEFLDPKIHTIRRDVNNEWKKDLPIHSVVNINMPDEFQFAPVLRCQRVQRIQIDHSRQISQAGPVVFVDYQLLDGASLALLVRNDGFPTISDFFAYFNEDFTGNLIHWTSLVYE